MEWWDLNENSFKSEKTIVFYNFSVKLIIWFEKRLIRKKCATRTTGLTFVLKDDSDSDIECLGAVQEEYETVDTANSGMHTNDQQNQPDELGRVLGQ